MNKIIKYGFLPIINDRERGQNVTKGRKLFESGHVLNVTEIENVSDKVAKITGEVVAQTSISNIYKIVIILDCHRNIKNSKCSCKAGLSGKCKHICAVITYINSDESSTSKTSLSQQWGKPSHRQLLGYDKGIKMSKLFPTPQKKSSTSAMKSSSSLDISTKVLGESLKHTPLYKILNLEEKNKNEIIAAEALVDMASVFERKQLNEKAEKLSVEIFQLQEDSTCYSCEKYISTPKYLFDFYYNSVCCDSDKGAKIIVQTVDQNNSSNWYEERRLRITASNAHKLKGNRFDVDKVVSNLLNLKNVETRAMCYGKKMEDVALKEYSNYFQLGLEITKVGLIICLKQPWLSCSPDAIATYGKNLWEKKLVEIKCPMTCKNVPIIQREPHLKINVPYLKFNQNCLELNQNHAIYTQIQIQMYVTSLSKCDLFVYSPKGSVMVCVKRDDSFLANLIPRLEKFYFTHYLPKLYAKYQEKDS